MFNTIESEVMTAEAVRAASLPGIMGEEQIRRIAPSVFASQPYHKMSSRYRFVPTTEVLDIINGLGYYPVKATQSRTRIEGKSDFTRHSLRFRHADTVIRANAQPRTVGDLYPELVLTNSHDGSSCFEFNAGLFRLVCLNGLVVADSTAGSFKVQHKGSAFEKDIENAVRAISESLPVALETVGRWKQIGLDRDEQIAFATQAVQIRETAVRVDPASLLRANREADRRRPDGSLDLDTTMNVVQEKLIRGGTQGTSSNGQRRMKTRAVNSIDEDMRINRMLWAFTEAVAKAKSGR